MGLHLSSSPTARGGGYDYKQKPQFGLLIMLTEAPLSMGDMITNRSPIFGWRLNTEAPRWVMVIFTEASPFHVGDDRNKPHCLRGL